MKTTSYIFIERHRAAANTESVAREIGLPIEISGTPLVQSLTPKSPEKSKPNMYSGNFGLTSFPLHSDLAHWFIPPKYLLLRCIVPNENIYTGVVQTCKLLQNLDSTEVNRAIFQPRKKQKGRLSLLKFKQKVDDEYLFRWDSLFIESYNQPANKISKTIIKSNKKEAFDKKYFLNVGDTLLINNWKSLHCRSNVPTQSQARIIERIYLSEIF